MITDEKRREVAKELRELATPGCIRYAEEFYEELREIIAFDRDGSFDGVANSLADLIDRPMCHDLVEHKQDPFIPSMQMADGYFHCSNCGWDGQIWEHIGFGDMLAYEAVHCPKCGAIIERRA